MSNELIPVQFESYIVHILFAFYTSGVLPGCYRFASPQVHFVLVTQRLGTDGSECWDQWACCLLVCRPERSRGEYSPFSRYHSFTWPLQILTYLGTFFSIRQPFNPRVLPQPRRTCVPSQHASLITRTCVIEMETSNIFPNRLCKESLTATTPTN